MNIQNNSLAIVAGMLSTLVGGGGVYLQWLDYNKKEEKVIEIKTQTQEATSLQNLSSEEKKLLQPLKAIPNPAKSNVQALNDMDINEHSLIKSAHSEPAKRTKNSVDDLDLDLPPPSEGFNDFDIDKSGF